MTNAGYSSSQYTILVQDYPSPIPQRLRLPLLAERLHAADDGRLRLLEQRRQLRQRDDAADDRQRRLGRGGAAGLSNVKTMELGSAFNGRRLCEKGVGLLEEEGLSNWKASGAVDKSEWINQIRTLEAIFGPYELQEDIHPNYWGSARAAQLPDAGVQRGHAEGRHVHDLGTRPERGRRAEHVAAIDRRRRCAAGAGRSRPALRPRDSPRSALRASCEDARVSASRASDSPRVTRDDARRRARDAARAVLRSRVRARADAVHDADRARARRGRACSRGCSCSACCGGRGSATRG